ncbi:MDR family MFS transporter [Emcibacter sp. SYSU 3D8]|uniref:MDR family MFS transporter n=1 Tax=Emcibacter sp. SYSU 3D8 TaxID=3133969 RepID=UPI0031FE8A35
MCLGMFMAILDVQVVVTSMPAIQSALAIPPDLVSWIQTAYLIAEIIAIPLTGLLTRVLTMRGLFFAAILVFSAASLGCALSESFATLIAWRVVQGFAGGVLIPLVFAAVFLLFPYRLQGIATTIAGVLAVLAPTVGPLVGGWVTETWSWHWLFLINIAPGLVAGAAVMAFLPRERPDPGHLRTIDMLALVLMALALAALEIGLKEAPGRGWTSGLVLALLALSLASGVGFVRRTLARSRPIVELRAFADRAFAVGCCLSFLLGVGLFGSVYLMPVFLGFVRGYGPFEIGQVMLVTGLAQLATAPIVVLLERRYDARWLTACGFALFGAGLAMSYFQTPRSGFDDMLWPQIVRGSAIMLCLLPPTRLALGHIPPERVADASGLFNLMRNLGGAIGIALIDTVVYGRAEGHGHHLAAELMAGSREAAAFVGLPLKFFKGVPLENVEASVIGFARPLVEKAGMVLAINEAWLLLTGFMALGLLVLPLVSSSAYRRPAPRSA